MGDNIFGFVTIHDGIKIHRTNCPNAVQMIGRYGYRVVSAKWTRRGPQSVFPVDIRITGEDQSGILTSVSEIVTKDQGIKITSINFDTNEGEFIGNLGLTVRNIEHLESLIARLLSIKGVYTVNRVVRNS